jgi:hypothetical protein
MTLTRKLTIALELFKSLNKCFSTNEHNRFTELREEILSQGVDSEEFDNLMTKSL